MSGFLQLLVTFSTLQSMLQRIGWANNQIEGPYRQLQLDFVASSADAHQSGELMERMNSFIDEFLVRFCLWGVDIV